jgi:hypothetical protein
MDDTLWHQIPSTFDHVGTSDPRFFDRYWFAANEPNGAGAVQLTIGAYRNMNVMDGGFIAVHDGRQHNVRASRSLRPRFEPAVGPLRVEVVEPLRRLRLHVAAGPQSVHGELDWTAALAAQEEVPRFTRVRGRVVEESRRFDQIGECSGWLDIDGRRVEVDRWWAGRDHSWGVRQQVGIREPATGPAEESGAGRLFAFLFFSTDRLGGHVQLAQFAGQPDYLTALLVDRRRHDADIEVEDASLSVQFHDDARPPRRFRRAELDIRLAAGQPLTLELDALGPAVAMPGLGYGGYLDGQGLGVWRGTDHVEHDVWDVRHHTEVVHPDGRVDRPVHRIQPVRVTARGQDLDGVGTGSMTLIAEGSLPRIGVG